MKINKIFIYLLMMLPSVLLQSCLKDDDDKFDESSATRLQKYLDKTQGILVGSQNGWALDYYPDKNQSYGGFVYTLQFTADEVTVGSELAPGVTRKSLYTMTTDNGPVLSFDSYNDFMHLFATPSSDMYEAYDGDFELIIDSIGEDKIKTHGVRSKNVMYLYKLEKPAADYINDVVALRDNFVLSGAEGSVNGNKVKLEFDSENLQATVDIVGDTTYTSAFNFTDKGIRLYKPVTVGNVSERGFVYDDATVTLKGANGSALDGIFTPAVAINAIGGSISSNDDAFTKTVEINHLDQFNFTTDADWLKITKNGNTLTISGEANNTGDVRTGVVTVSVGAQKAEFTVNQADIDKDIVGSYYVAFYNSSNNETVLDGELSKVSGNNYKLSFTVTRGTWVMPLEIPLTYDEKSGKFLWTCGQLVCPTVVKGYYIFGIFVDSQGYWTGYNTSGAANEFSFEHDDLNGTYSIMQGDYPIVYLGANGSTQLSSANYAGYVEQLIGLQLLKKTAENSAKSFNFIK